MKDYRKLQLDFMVPPEYQRRAITDIVRAICTQINRLSEGKAYANYNALSTVTESASMTFAQGDQVQDSNPTAQGSIAPGNAAHYVRGGWIMTGDGTLHEMRFFTGD